NIRVKIVARHVRVSWVVRQHPWRVRLLPHPPHTPASAKPERDPARTEALLMPASIGDSSATGSERERSAAVASKPRRQRRRHTSTQIVARTVPTSSSVGGGRGRKRSAPPLPSVNTPSRTS